MTREKAKIVGGNTVSARLYSHLTNGSLKMQISDSYFRERLEAWQDVNRDMGDRFAAVIEQRDELAVALQRILDADGGETILGEIARAALAKVQS